MIEVVKADEGLPWTTADEQNWDAFLHTATGQRLIPKFIEQATPTLKPKGETNELMIAYGQILNMQVAANVLLALSHAPPKPVQNDPTYPDLLDDKAWPGDKLEQPSEEQTPNTQ